MFYQWRPTYGPVLMVKVSNPKKKKKCCTNHIIETSTRDVLLAKCKLRSLINGAQRGFHYFYGKHKRYSQKSEKRKLIILSMAPNVGFLSIVWPK